MVRNSDTRLAQVPGLFKTAMKARGFEPVQIDHAERLWADFVEVADPSPRKPAIYAASVDYLIGRLDFCETSQGELARIYGTSTASISQTQRQIQEALAIAVFDQRYSTLQSPILDAMTRFEAALASRLGGAMGSAQPPEPMVLDDLTRARLRALPLSDEVWSIGRRLLPTLIEEGGLVQPAGLMCVGEDSGLIFFNDMSLPTPGEDLSTILVEGLLEGIQNPMLGQPRRPSRVVVAQPSVAAHASALLDDLGVQVVVGPTPRLDDAFESLSEHLMGSREDESYLSAPAVTPELVGALFRSAARFARARIWERAFDSQLLALDLNRWGFGRACLSIIGHAGVSVGLLIFRTYEDFETFRAFSPGDHRPRSGPGIEILSLNLEEASVLSRTMLKEALTHGWETAGPDLYPTVLQISRDNVAIAPTADQIRAAIFCADALTDFAERHPEAFTQLDPLTELVGSAEFPAFEPVEIVYPHPDNPHPIIGPVSLDPDSVAPRYRALARYLAGGGTLAEEEVDALKDSLAEAFGRAKEGQVLADKGLYIDWSLVVVDLAWNYLQASLLDLDDEDLTHVLLTLVPRKIMTMEDVGWEIVTELRLLWRFLGRAFDAPHAPAIETMLGQPGMVKKIDRAMLEPSNWGMAKSMMMMGREAGFDISSQAGLQQFMATVNKGSALTPGAHPSTGRNADKAGKESARTKRKKAKASRKSRRKNR